MSARPYARYVYVSGGVEPDWRWRRAAELAAGDPHNGQYSDDAPTLAAVRVLLGDPAPDLADVRAARDVFLTGGLDRRKVEALLLTALSEEEVGERVGLCEPAVTAYRKLFFAVRGDDQLTRLVRFTAEQSSDPLVKAAWHGPVAIEAQVAIETGVGAADLPPGLVEGFERRRLMNRLYEGDLGAFLRAVNRLRLIDDGLSPGLLHTGRRSQRRARAGGDAG